jgi:hypothetical protein
MLEEFRKEWVRIRQEKRAKIADLIKQAAVTGVRVILLVHSEMAERLAWGYLASLGLNASEFVSVKPALPENRDGASLCIPYESDCL